jgi:lipopolysaccharide export system permease protein
MRWPRTLSLYVTREVVQYASLGLAAITLVMLTRSLVRVLDQLIGAGFQIDDLLTVASLLGAMLTIYALPVSFLFGVLLAIGRMASDVEITAMRACGIGMRALLLPIGILGLCLSVLTLKLTVDVEPAARRAMATAVQRMLVRGASVEAGRFKAVAKRMFFVDEREAEGRLRGIVISDRTDPERPFLVFAESGELRLDESRAEMVLMLERGDVHLEPRGDADDRYQRVGFERFEYRINIGEAMGTGLPRPREMTREQLRAVVARIEAGEEPGPLRDPPVEYATNLHRRYALPAAPALFALVGVPLGIRRKRGARSYGVILCAVLAFGYYALHSFCELLATERGFPVEIAVWLPNVAYAVLGIVLVLHARRSA